jgi:MarR family 2-MHQ and catechol resistance regulon transcriptional repressor
LADPFSGPPRSRRYSVKFNSRWDNPPCCSDMPKTPDISTPKLVIVLVRATRSLAEFLEAGLAREGINNPDFAILEALLHKGRLAISDIEQKVHLATAPLKLAIDRLKRRGMVRAHSDRSHPGFELTEDGRERISRIYARHTEDIEAVISNALTSSSRRKTSTHGTWNSLPVAGIIPRPMGRSPLWVPFSAS